MVAGPQRGGLQAVGDGVDLVALALERADERQADPLVVLGDQHARHAVIVGPWRGPARA